MDLMQDMVFDCLTVNDVEQRYLLNKENQFRTFVQSRLNGEVFFEVKGISPEGIWAIRIGKDGQYMDQMMLLNSEHLDRLRLAVLNVH